MVVTIETDAGITGIGEGGSKDMLKQCAGRLIGQDPQYIERLWQDMSRAFFYPPGREKEHALGALDLALWDITRQGAGPARPCAAGWHGAQLLRVLQHGGHHSRHPTGMSVKERAQLTIAAGYRAFRMDAADAPANTTYNTRERLNQLYEECAQAREGVGKDGDWCVDFHQRFDLADAVRGCSLIEDLAPFFVEDPVRTEAFQEDLPILRAHGEGADRGGRRVGQSLGLQQAGGEPRYRLSCAPRCPTSAASPR